MAGKRAGRSRSAQAADLAVSGSSDSVTPINSSGVTGSRRSRRYINNNSLDGDDEDSQEENTKQDSSTPSESSITSNNNSRRRTRKSLVIVEEGEEKADTKNRKDEDEDDVDVDGNDENYEQNDSHQLKKTHHNVVNDDDIVVDGDATIDDEDDEEGNTTKEQISDVEDNVAQDGHPDEDELDDEENDEKLNGKRHEGGRGGRKGEDDKTKLTSREKKKLADEGDDDEEELEAEVEDGDGDGDEDDGHSEITRCICGHQELQTSRISKNKNNTIDPGLFIQCDQCQVWQHGFCVGFSSEDEVPEVYYCEWCRPELHLVVVRPWGKTSRYIPHMEGQTTPGKDDDDALTNGNDIIHKGSVAPGGSRSSRAQRHKKDLNERDGFIDEKPAINNARDESSSSSIGGVSSSPSAATITTRSSRRSHSSNNYNNDNLDNNNNDNNGSNDNNNINNSASPQITMDAASSMAITTIKMTGTTTASSAAQTEAEKADAHRRKTMNSSRDANFEETLKRVLEESAHDLDSTKSTEGDIPPKLEKNPNGLHSAPRSPSASSMNKRHIHHDSDSATTGTTMMSSRKKRSVSTKDRTEIEMSSEDQSSTTSTNKRRAGSRNTPKRSSATDDIVHSDHNKHERSRQSSPATEEGGEEGSSSSSKRKRQRTKNSKRLASSEAASTKGSGVNSSGKSTPKNGSGGVRPAERSKPRIPPPRSTMSEMRKRVAAILEFIGRTQVDLAGEHKERHQLLLDRNSLHRQLGGETSNTIVGGSAVITVEADTDSNSNGKFSSLFELHEANLDHMDALTRKLLHWEDQFGQFGDRRSN